MKKIFLSICALIIAASIYANEPSAISEKALAAFKQSFENAKDVKWLELKTSYEVSFRQNDIQSRIRYDEDGNILHTIRYYFAENLPLIINAKIAKRFADKKVFGVTEISNEEGTAYYIILEDAKHWTHVKADSYGNFFVEKKLKKA